MTNFTRSDLRRFGGRALRVLGNAADVAVQLRRDARPINVVALGAKIVSEALNERGSSPFGGWLAVEEVGVLDAFLLRLCQRDHLVSPMESRREGQMPVSGVVNGVRVGWIDCGSWCLGPYTPEPEDRAAAALRQLAWTVGSSVKYHEPPIGSASLVADPVVDAMPSGTATKLWERQRPFVEAGKRRAVLLVGEPGTGKSHAIRFVANSAGGLRLRLHARDLEHLRSLGALVRFLRPSAVMIDDLDRARDPSAFLGELDELLVEASLLLVTVNDVKKLDPAAVRRFDDIEVIKSLDDAVLDALLIGVSPRVADRLRALPVRYIEQYRGIAEVVGHEAAELELERIVRQRNLVVSMAGEE